MPVGRMQSTRPTGTVGCCFYFNKNNRKNFNFFFLLQIHNFILKHCKFYPLDKTNCYQLAIRKKNLLACVRWQGGGLPTPRFFFSNSVKKTISNCFLIDVMPVAAMRSIAATGIPSTDIKATGQ